MIVNLYVDHMMSQPATSSDDVWAATRDHSQQFSEAAKRIGLTPAEYREFRSNLLDGNVMYVRLPRRLDAMSANHRGKIYAVKNAVMWKPVMGWKVALADGNTVYVPQICGNISMQRRPVALAHLATKPKSVAAAKAKFHPALGVVAAAPAPAAAAPVAETPVVFVPPPVAPVAAAPAAASAPAAAATAAGGHFSPFFLAIPAVLGAIVAGTTHHDSPTVPSCSHGSNLLNACQQ